MGMGIMVMGESRTGTGYGPERSANPLLLLVLPIHSLQCLRTAVTGHFTLLFLILNWHEGARAPELYESDKC